MTKTNQEPFAIQAYICFAIAGRQLFFDSSPSRLIVSTLRRKTLQLFLDAVNLQLLAPGADSRWPALDSNRALSLAVYADDAAVLEAFLRSGHDPLTQKNTWPVLEFLRDTKELLEDDIVETFLRYISTDNLALLPAETKSKLITSNQVAASQSSHRPQSLGDTDSKKQQQVSLMKTLSGVIELDDGELCQRIIDQGVLIDGDINDCEDCPVRPLFKAMYGNKGACARTLLASGASVEAADCIHFPLALQNPVCLAVWYLLSSGDPSSDGLSSDGLSSDGLSSDGLSSDGLSSEVLSLLLDTSLKQRVCWTDSGLNPFHVAAMKADVLAMRTLLDHVKQNLGEYWYQHKKQDRESFLSMLLDTTGFTAPNLVWPGTLSEDLRISGTALHYAVAARSLACVELLTSNGASVDALDCLSRSPLVLAIQMGFEAAARHAIELGANQSAFDCDNRTALMTAAKYGSMEIIRCLDTRQIDLMSDLGENVLHHALQRETEVVEAFRYFVDKGASPHQHAQGRNSPIALAFMTLPIPEALITWILNDHQLSGVDDLNAAAIISYLAYMKRWKSFRMVAHIFRIQGNIGQSIHQISNLNSSPLCVAAMHDMVECFQSFAECGADIDNEGAEQGSPLMAASTYGRLEAVKWLVRNGAMISYTNEDGIYRNAFVAGRHHPDVKRWFLVGRFCEQGRLTTREHWNDRPAITAAWSGSVKFEWRMTGSYKRRKNESGFGYFCWLQRIKRESRGLIVR
ncbi:Ankyrin-3 [Colletotrichum trifolii]|uniref:Ankyrin-3 n=1 Tax=Colletotrichum trifolii TaxID=5466 RepID=A0A4R8Q916_COLTR|nr:Ankyrin-3 [Colletotrichum trifolii]